MKYSLDKYKFFVATKTDGTPYQVVAVSTYAGRKIRGVAKCDPRDKFSISAGKKLAAARCNLKVAEKRAKRAQMKYAEAIDVFNESCKYRDDMAAYLQDSTFELEEAKRELNEVMNYMGE